MADRHYAVTLDQSVSATSHRWALYVKLPRQPSFRLARYPTQRPGDNRDERFSVRIRYAVPQLR
jgi:hypothetical protein